MQPVQIVTLSLEELTQHLRTVVREEMAQVSSRPQVLPGRRNRIEKRLLSMRATAERLGTRFGTVQQLIAEKKLRTVKFGGRNKIPVSEIERIEREGATRVHPSRGRMEFGSDGAPLGAEEAAKD